MSSLIQIEAATDLVRYRKHLRYLQMESYKYGRASVPVIFHILESERIQSYIEGLEQALKNTFSEVYQKKVTSVSARGQHRILQQALEHIVTANEINIRKGLHLLVQAKESFPMEDLARVVAKLDGYAATVIFSIEDSRKYSVKDVLRTSSTEALPQKHYVSLAFESSFAVKIVFPYKCSNCFAIPVHEYEEVTVIIGHENLIGILYIPYCLECFQKRKNSLITPVRVDFESVGSMSRLTCAFSSELYAREFRRINRENISYHIVDFPLDTVVEITKTIHRLDPSVKLPSKLTQIEFAPMSYEASALLEKLISDPRDIEACYGLGVYYHKSATYRNIPSLRQSIYYYDRVLLQQSSHTMAYRNRARARVMLGDDKPRDSDWEIALEALHGVTALSNESLHKAIMDFDHALAIAPYDAECYVDRGISYLILVEDFTRRTHTSLQNALMDFEKAIDLDSTCTRAYFYRALVYEQVFFEVDLAREDYKMCLQIGNAPESSLKLSLRLKFLNIPLGGVLIFFVRPISRLLCSWLVINAVVLGMAATLRSSQQSYISQPLLLAITALSLSSFILYLLRLVFYSTKLVRGDSGEFLIGIILYPTCGIVMGVFQYVIDNVEQAINLLIVGQVFVSSLFIMTLIFVILLPKDVLTVSLLRQELGGPVH